MQRGHAETAVKAGSAVIAALAGSAAAEDLQGVYAGLGFSKGSGDIAYDDGVYSFEGNAGSGFVGYNFLQGDWLFGAELSISNGGFAVPEPTISPGIEAGTVRDLKARVGRVFGRTLVYGVVGRSNVDLRIEAVPTAEGTATATALGIGFETALGSRTFVGAEYLARDLDFFLPDAPRADEGATLDTISIRLGMRF